jgi:hypothetical protein
MSTEDTVSLTVVPAAEAEIVCAFLRSEGIRCLHKPSDALHLTKPVGGFSGLREIRVLESDLAAARALIESEPSDG